MFNEGKQRKLKVEQVMAKIHAIEEGEEQMQIIKSAQKGMTEA